MWGSRSEAEGLFFYKSTLGGINMKNKKARRIWVVLGLLMTLFSTMTLSRCGSGVGPTVPGESKAGKF